MLEIDIPLFKKLNIENIVFDYNGTIAEDGDLIKGIKENLIDISNILNIYIITADTYGTVQKNFADINVNVEIISKENGTLDKVNFIKKIGAEKTIAVGNGNNDELMLKESAVGIAILGNEGLATKAMLASDLILKDINDLFDMIKNKNRLIATLRK